MFHPLLFRLCAYLVGGDKYPVYHLYYHNIRAEIDELIYVQLTGQQSIVKVKNL